MTAGRDILIVEDAETLARTYAAAVERRGYRAHVALSLAAARELLATMNIDVALLDLYLPDGDGLTLLPDLSARIPCIAMTADASITRAVEATRRGAFDFLVKPFSDEKLFSTIDAALRAVRENRRARSEPDLDEDVDAIIRARLHGASTVMTNVRSRIARLARSNATVFIVGESGVGKELCARAIHDASARASGPFHALNCGAIPDDLLESEVFGYVKGAFTGATSDKTGAAQAAHGGALFLDEICEMPVALQTKLLRFLETSTVTPVGSTAAQRVDVRIICATNRDPKAEVAAGRFREDLFYRLYVLPLEMPPLRARGDDAIELARTFLDSFAAEEGKTFDGFSPEAEARIRGGRWLGNVRELSNAVRRAAVLNDGGLVGPDLMFDESETRASEVDGRWRFGAADNEAGQTRHQLAAAELVGLSLADIERLVIEATIDASNGSLPAAARKLRVSPSTLYRKRDAWR